jgi:outer membrane protein
MNNKVKKMAGIFCIALLPLFNLQAQTTHQLTAAQAGELAIKNVIDVKNANIDYQLQVAKNEEVTGSARPQVSGSAQLTHYLKLPQIQIPNTTDFNIYNILIREGILKDNGAGAPVKITTNNGAIGLNNLSFVAPWNTSASVQVQQLLFQPDVLVGLQARKSALELATQNIDVAKDKAKEAAIKNYYAVLIALKQKTFVIDGIKRLNKLISDQNQIYKNGFIEKLDIDKSTVALNNLTSNLSQLDNAIAISSAILKQSLNINQKDSIVYTEELNEKTISENTLQEANFNFNNRSEIRSLNAVTDLLKLDVKRNKLGYYPTAAAFVNAGINGQANRSFSAFTGKTWFWYSTVLIGLNVTVPIWDGGQRKQKIKTAQLNLQKTENTISNVKSLITMEQEIALNALSNALTSFNIQTKNVALATKVYETVKKKYEQGLSSAQEILLAEGEIQQAQSNYYRAMYEATVAKVAYLKALGKL